METLPLVLLEILSAWKEDLSTSTAELVHGKPLRLPSDLLQQMTDQFTDYTFFSGVLCLH